MKRLLALLLLAGVALAGSGTLTIGSVSGSSPGPYTVTMTGSVSGVAVGDDFGAFLSDGTSAIYRVTTVTGGSQQLVVADVRTSSYGGPFGPPVAGSAWYGTPAGGGGDFGALSKPPRAARAWDAALNLNATNVSGRILATAGAASVSSSTSAYASARSLEVPCDAWSADGAAVRVKANLRQATGSGVNMRLMVATTTCTALTSVGTYEFLIVREDSNTLVVYSGGSARDSVSVGLFAAPYVSVNLQIMGGDAAGGSANDFWHVERVR